MAKSKIKWSILIATVGQRSSRFRELLKVLMPQVRDHDGEIEVIAYWNNGEYLMGCIRQKLVEEARGEYISFVDDDDMVPEYYCNEVMKAISKNPDYVGWQMQVYEQGNKLKPTFHSLKYKGWDEDDEGWYRNISHLNPIKKSVALNVSFVAPRDTAEDSPWAQKIVPYVKTEEYIDRVMYLYQHDSNDSVWRGDLDFRQIYQRPKVTYKHFRYHSNSTNSFDPRGPRKREVDGC